MRRLKDFLIEQSWWSETEETEQKASDRTAIIEMIKDAESISQHPPESILDDVYDEETPNLRRQRERLRSLLRE